MAAWSTLCRPPSAPPRLSSRRAPSPGQPREAKEAAALEARLPRSPLGCTMLSRKCGAISRSASSTWKCAWGNGLALQHPSRGPWGWRQLLPRRRRRRWRRGWTATSPVPSTSWRRTRRGSDEVEEVALTSALWRTRRRRKRRRPPGSGRCDSRLPRLRRRPTPRCRRPREPWRVTPRAVSLLSPQAPRCSWRKPQRRRAACRLTPAERGAAQLVAPSSRPSALGVGSGATAVEAVGAEEVGRSPARRAMRSCASTAR